MHPETRVRKFSLRHYPNISITVSIGCYVLRLLYVVGKDLCIRFHSEDLGPVSTKDKLSL